MNSAPISSPALTGMNDSRQAKSSGAPPALAFGAFLSQELTQRREPAAESRVDSPPTPSPAPAKGEGSGETIKAESGEREEVAEKATVEQSSQASPELLALMVSVGQLIAADKTVATPGDAAGDELVELDVASRSKRDPKGLDLSAAELIAEGSPEESTKPMLQAAGKTLPSDAMLNAPAGVMKASDKGFAALLGPDQGISTGTLPGGTGLAATAQSLSATTASVATAPSTDSLAPQVGTPDWDQALGNKVVWMAGNGLQSASLTLNPPDLGPLKVVVSMTNNQATASFVAAQPEVRQAIEAAMPKLRDMMNEAGIQLGQTSVDAGSSQQAGQSEQRPGSSSEGRDRRTGLQADTGVATPVRTASVSSGTGLVDTFA